MFSGWNKKKVDSSFNNNSSSATKTYNTPIIEDYQYPKDTNNQDKAQIISFTTLSTNEILAEIKRKLEQKKNSEQESKQSVKSSYNGNGDDDGNKTHHKAQVIQYPSKTDNQIQIKETISNNETLISSEKNLDIQDIQEDNEINDENYDYEINEDENIIDDTITDNKFIENKTETPQNNLHNETNSNNISHITQNIKTNPQSINLESNKTQSIQNNPLQQNTLVKTYKTFAKQEEKKSTPNKEQSESPIKTYVDEINNISFINHKTLSSIEDKIQKTINKIANEKSILEHYFESKARQENLKQDKNSTEESDTQTKQQKVNQGVINDFDNKKANNNNTNSANNKITTLKNQEKYENDYIYGNSSKFRSGYTLEDLAIETMLPHIENWINNNLEKIVLDIVTNEVKKALKHVFANN